jgi:hypothetical protein
MTLKYVKRANLTPETARGSLLYFVQCITQGQYDKRSLSGLVMRLDIRPEEVELFPQLDGVESVWLGFRHPQRRSL